MEIETVSQLAKAAAEQATKPEAVEIESGLADKFSQLMQLGTPAINQATNLVTQAGEHEPLIKATNMVHESGATAFNCKYIRCESCSFPRGHVGYPDVDEYSHC